MKTLIELHCPECQSSETEPFKKYNTVHNGERRLLKCDECGDVFSETAGTPARDIKSPISKVSSAVKIRGEGMGLRATGRILGMHKNTVSTWERLFGDQKYKRGPKRKKCQAPLKEHPETELDESEIHANHVEANNAAMRRRNSAFRRRTDTCQDGSGASAHP
jgi:transposase-like protein